MAELALEYRAGKRNLTLTDVAQSKGLSQGYLEEIASALKRANLIQGKKGPNGGYLLTRAPQAITAEEILTALEGSVHLVGCQQAPGSCPAEGRCSSRSFWDVLQRRVLETVRETTLADILQTTS